MKIFKTPIAFKIFGMSSTILVLLIAIAYLNQVRISQVNNKLIDIAEYLTPIKKLVAQVNIHVLEQEIHFERLVGLHEQSPIETAAIKSELSQFLERGELVDQEIDRAIAKANQAAMDAKTQANIIQFARLEPLLETLEEEHQEFHDKAIFILELLQSEEREIAELLDEQLEEYEKNFDAHSAKILRELNIFTANSAREAQLQEQKSVQTGWLLAAIASALGLSIAFTVTWSLLQPVKKLMQGAKSVEDGDLDINLTVVSQDEIGDLTHSFNQMVREIRQKEKIKATFGQYVDPRIVETLMAQKSETELGTNLTHSYKGEMTIFFSDLAGFSAISEMLTAESLVRLINQYLTLASEPIVENKGVIDQYIGDAVTAFWGEPFVKPEDHARLACFAALEQENQLNKLRRILPEIVGFKKGLPELNCRIGLATGEVITGNIGSSKSKSYTVMGQAVLVAEELENASKIYGTKILITEETKKLAGESIFTRPIDLFYSTALAQTIKIYELINYVDLLSVQEQGFYEIFTAGFDAFHENDFDLAATKFNECIQRQANDMPTTFYLKRLADQLVVTEPSRQLYS